MAYVLPVGPGAGFGDFSPSAPPGPQQPDPASSIGSEGGAAAQINGAQSTWTQSETNGPQSFEEALKSSQKTGTTLVRSAAKAHSVDTASLVAPMIAMPLVGAAPQPLSAAKAAPKGAGSEPSTLAALAHSSSSVAAAAKSDAASQDAGELQALAGGASSSAQTQASAQASQAASTFGELAAEIKGKTGESESNGANTSAQETESSHSTLPTGMTLAQSDSAAESKSLADQGGGSREGSQSGSQDSSEQLAAASVLGGAGTGPQVATPDASAQVSSAGFAERISVIRQIADQVSAAAPAAASGPQSVTVTIHPQHWGELTINLTMASSTTAPEGRSAASGAVTATIIAQSDAVKNALQGQVKELQDSLQSAGIKLQKIDIITAGAAAGTVAAGHSSAQAGLNSGSQNHASGHHSPDSSGAGSSPQGSAGDPGNRPQQQFASHFAGLDDFSSIGLPSLATTAGAAGASDASMTPIGLVEATRSASAGRVNMLA